MPSKKVSLPPINYTNRDFASIKNDLENFAKRYYPDTQRDFSEASFGAMMIDMTAYVGDVLSFYLDYQVNESFLDTALEYNNVSRLAKQLGYRQSGASKSSGVINLYIVVPASSTAIGPDMRYAPILRTGTKFISKSESIFTLTEDVDFGKSGNEMVVAATNSSTGQPTKYAIKTHGKVVSGELKVQYIEVGDYQRFPKFFLNDSNITEIISVIDTSGNKYFEVENLSQDTIYVPVTNKTQDKDLVPFIMKPRAVPRRYIVEHMGSTTSIQFGFGSDSNMTSDVVSDPSNVIMDAHGRDYVTDRSFDPTNLIETDKLGIAPSNTTLSVVYRANGSNQINISANSLVSTADVDMRFKNSGLLAEGEMREVISSLEFENEDPIVGDTSQISTDEIRQRAFGAYSAQNRAVTKQDYMALVYNMPGKFGSIKRLNIAQDKDSFKRNLNLFVVSENPDGYLIPTPPTLKNNLKTWLSNYKMINDSIDILDGKIINFSITYEIMVDRQENRFSAISRANAALANRFANNKFEFGEPIRYSEVFQVLKGIGSVLDVGEVKIKQQTGVLYSDVSFNLDNFISPDGRLVMAPQDYIYELRFPTRDIIGSVI
tara:strand:- start:801 stop:2606 length:1806 start_codon:yes stop_codon:yes gene_type:complete